MVAKKRALYSVMTAALACSMVLGASNPQVISAKQKKTKLKTKKITLKVGKSKKILFKNKKKGAKYTFTNKKKKIVKVSKSGKVKALAAGTAKIVVKEKKKNSKKKVKIGTVKVVVTAAKKKNTSKPASTAASKATAPAASADASKSTPKAAESANPTGNPAGESGKPAESSAPTVAPTDVPTVAPTAAPTAAPTVAPTKAPTAKPTQKPQEVYTRSDKTGIQIYLDSISDDNLIGEVNGIGYEPTPTPAPTDPSEATPEPTPAVLFNVDGEDGTAGVLKGRSGKEVFTVVDGGANDTKKGIKVSGRTAGWHGPQVDITDVAESNSTYKFSVYIKQDTGASQNIGLCLAYSDDSGEKYPGIKEVTCPSGEWVLCEVETKIPEHAGTITVYVQPAYGDGNNTIDFCIDEFNMVGVAKEKLLEGVPDLTAGLAKAKAGNPAITSRLTADPWAMEYNGRIYVYGTNDSQQYFDAGNADNNYARINTLNCYSSADLVNWTDHGEIAVAGSKGAAKWAGNSWAPAAAHKKINGKEKFFLYFANSANSIGVLTADSPTGPWTDPIGKALIDRNVPGCSQSEIGWLFDPAVLVDDDGQAYLYFGGIGDTSGKSADFLTNPACARVVKLGDDMTSVVGEAVTIDAPFMFEDSGINKIGDKYYYSYCSNWAGEIDRKYDGIDCPTAQIAVMESDNPMTGFKFVGCVLKNPGSVFGSTGNNHHCFTEFKGKMYAFYHTKADTVKLGCKQDYRTTYVDLASDFLDEDGKAIYTNMTKDGVDAVGTVDPYKTIEAESFAYSTGVATQLNDLEGSNAEWVKNYSLANNGNADSFVGLSNVDFGDSGASKLTLKAGDIVDGEYKDFNINLAKTVTGTHDVIVVFKNKGIMVDSYKFE